MIGINNLLIEEISRIDTLVYTARVSFSPVVGWRGEGEDGCKSLPRQTVTVCFTHTFYGVTDPREEWQFLLPPLGFPADTAERIKEEVKEFAHSNHPEWFE